MIVLSLSRRCIIVSSTLDPRLDELLSRWEQGRQQGNPQTPEDLCREHPELIDRVRWYVRALDELGPDLATVTPTANFAGATLETGLTEADRTPLEMHTRFRIDRHHARGGLGEILVGEDLDLQRPVALKRMLRSQGRGADAEARFLREVLVTGRLEHPGVVPVYAVGRGPDGSPCFAMRFVHGETLAEEIRRFHLAEQPTRDPRERRLAFRQLLGRFVSVCNTVAYAHSRGVVHRDLKPANIISGPYGETLVLDWGLAKDLERGERQSPVGTDAKVTDANLTPEQTLAGTTLGTPAYMSPEQAAGRVDAVGPASDIYSLGATLYSLLTGRSPVPERDIGRVLERVKKGDILPPRQVTATVPAALDAVCRKAMSFNVVDRYPSALDLAGDIEHWMADEPVSGYRASLTERISRWGRRHRPVVRAGALALIATVMVLGVATILLRQANAKERESTQLAEQRKAAAIAEYRRARKAVDDLFVTVSQSKLNSLPGGQAIRKELLMTALRYYQEFLAEHGDDPANREDIAATSTKVAMIVGEVESAEAAIAWHEKAVAGWRELVSESPDRVLYRRELAGALDRSGIHLSRSGRQSDAINAQEEAIGLLEPLRAMDPDDLEIFRYLSRAYTNLAVAQGRAGQVDAAIRTGHAGIAVDEVLVQRTPENDLLRGNLVAKYTNLGLDLLGAGRLDEAARALESGRSIAKKMCDELDTNPARATRIPDANSHPRNRLAQTEINLGVVALNQARYREARASFLAARSLCKSMSDANPMILQYRDNLLAAEANAVFAGLKDRTPPNELLLEADSACASGQKLVDADANNPEYLGRLAASHGIRAIVLARLNRKRDAEQALVTADDTLKRIPGTSATPTWFRGSVELSRAMTLIEWDDVSGAAKATMAVRKLMPKDPNFLLQVAHLWVKCATRSTSTDRTVHLDAALDAVQAAVKHGFRDPARLRTDTELEPLRARDDFQRLLQEMEKR